MKKKATKRKPMRWWLCIIDSSLDGLIPTIVRAPKRPVRDAAGFYNHSGQVSRSVSSKDSMAVLSLKKPKRVHDPIEIRQIRIIPKKRSR